MNPSLALIPCAYDTGKLYSVLPDTGLGDLTVSRNGTATYLGSNGLIKTALANEPRLEFNTDGTFKGVLVEPAATNLLIRSEEFEDASWVKSESTTTANFAISPNGIMSADTIEVNSNNAVHRITRTIGITTGTTYTLSIYAKKNDFDFIFFRENIDGNFTNTFFNISDGNVGSIGLGRTAKIQNAGNGWYRCSITGTSISTSYSLGFGVSNADGVILFLGNGTDYNLIWGAQLEVGSVATSYIPTVASTITRPADVISKTGIADLIGQTEGTIYMEVNVKNLSLETYFLRIADTSGTNTNVISLRKLTSNNIRSAITAPTTSGTVNISSATFTAGILKIALAYKSGEIALCVNGANLTANGTFSFNASLSIVDIGNNINTAYLNDCITTSTLYPIRLTNAQLQALTTL